MTRNEVTFTDLGGQTLHSCHLKPRGVCLKTKPHVSINEKFKVIVKWHIHWIQLKELQAWCLRFKPINEDINSSNEDSESNFKDNNSGGDEPKFPPGFTPDDVVEDATPDDVVEDNMKEIGSEKN
nr:hypothetical protein [Tanacetum cinerariifolium]